MRTYGVGVLGRGAVGDRYRLAFKHSKRFRCVSVFEPTWKCGSRINFEIVCERGLICHNWFSVKWYTRDAEGEFISKRLDSGGDRWDHYHALIEAIEQNNDVHPNHHDAPKHVRIQDAAIRSKQAGQTITL